MKHTFIKRTISLLISIMLCASMIPYGSFADTSDAILYGDVNSDGYVNSTDALNILQAAVEILSFSSQQIKAGDVDGSGTIESVDALYVLQHSVNKIDKFPIEIALEKANKEAAQKVDSKISAIGIVTLERESFITDAREAYESLTVAQKELVTMLDTLISAEETLERLKIEATIFDVYVTNAAYGAKGDGVTNDRAAIQAAIDAAHNAGGGTVRLDSGKTFVSGNLLMRSNVTLVIEEGTKLLQSGNPLDFVDPKNNFAIKELTFGAYVDSSIQWDAAAFYNYPFIYAGEGTKNIKITGKGTIEMNSGNDPRGTMTMQAIGLFQVDGYELSEFTVQKYHAYCIKAVSCSNGLYKNLTVDITGGTIGGTDGINLNNCQNIRVTGCNLYTGDDGVYICSAYRDPREGLWYNNENPLPPENIEIDNNHCEVAWNDTKAFCFIMWGAEFPDQKQVEVNNIYIHDNYFETFGAWTGNWNLETKTFDFNGSTNAMKNIRFENNEIGTIQSNFYTLPISDVYGFDCMTSLRNGDFSEKDIYWVSRKGGSSGYTQDGYGYIDSLDKADAALYQGIKLTEGQSYEFKADIKSSGAPVRLFAKDQVTGELIASKVCNSTTWETVALRFTAPKTCNYHIGLERGTAINGFAYIDNASLNIFVSDMAGTPNGTTVLTNQKPDTSGAGDGLRNALGLRFAAKKSGTISQVRLYTASNESGEHLVSLWNYETGELLTNGFLVWNIASGYEGWREFDLPSPIAIEPNVQYALSITSGPNAVFVKGSNQLATRIENNDLYTFEKSGLYSVDYKLALTDMPTGQTSSNYFRDVVFVPSDDVTPEPQNAETIFTTQTPTVTGSGGQDVLGTRFYSSVNGKITKVRMYADARASGTHTITLWEYDTKTLLAGPYNWTINAGTTGWIEYELPTPLEIKANTKYVVAISVGPNGLYAKGENQIASPITNGHLTADACLYTGNVTLGTAQFPGDPETNGGISSNNYFRDVVFIPN